jgi:D-xylose transport system permease protein
VTGTSASSDVRNEESVAGPGASPRPHETTPRALVTTFQDQLRRGDLGLLPVIVGLIVIWTVFQTQNDRFLSPGNLTNLTLQIAAVGTIAVGLFLVLIVAEIDLSVGIVSGLCGGIMAVLSVNYHFNAALAILGALMAGALIGTFHGLIITRIGVPSFVVTLAGFIGWQGALLLVLGNAGTINLPPSGITALTGTFLPRAVGWVFAVLIVGTYTATRVTERRHRLRAGLSSSSTLAIGLTTSLLGLALGATVLVLNSDRGIPLSLLIFAGFVVVTELVTKRTGYGRYAMAVGGNTEAARRAGIPVDRIRVSVMIFSSTMAAAGGVLFASRLLSVSQSSGSGDVLLNAIAAVVIGGTSLFGGRGTAYSALLGMLVVGSISNGMDLLSLNSAVKFLITGGVLLLAVGVDALARRAAREA